MTRVTRTSAAKMASSTAGQMQLSSPSAPLAPSQSRRKKPANTEPDSSPPTRDPVTPNTARKRSRPGDIKKDENANELPHNLGSIPELIPKDETSLPTDLPKKRARKAKKEELDEVIAKATATESSPKKSKNNSYGLKPGQTPYPNWLHPTADECEEVTRLLSSVHGDVKPPKTIPTPSLTVSGCGEVPSVLDALIRTRLSAATSGTNSSRAFAGLVSKFGVLKEGIGKGSVDWNKVRLADTKDIFEAIKSGGLADVKSKDIKKILQMVWEENQARRDALISQNGAPGSENENPKERNAEVVKAEENILSLDHLHLLSNDDAFDAMTKFPGIGPKTASCVLLFCMQRPSFAVDTHVFRLCKWLGWVPSPGDPAGLLPGAKGKFPGPTRNSTYAHCEVRIPDQLKYPLHQLFIKHGKTCPRCRAITGENSEGWDQGCVIDHLVQRTGGRKSNFSPKKSGSQQKTKGKKRHHVEDSESELSDLVSGGEESASATD
ncbi:DNA glycosylase [Polyplosphaeria fusca]|uniref:DNA glycosylase n=1 Tax=Polyplosphaeria fusca TaxID=682080 RepID=A0A9P4RD75_9PLEO|nr:DNA glycosylase [Polyplosphaeria fusca]